jgi:hypothetical protein
MAQNPPQPQQRTYFTRLHVAGLLLTLFGISLFSYFIYAIGINELLAGIERFGWLGFVVIVGLYFFRICGRALAWKLSVHEPYALSMRDTVPAVMIGEALSATIPLGILISGTSKAIAVRKRIPLVAGLSSVATENLFYSFTTTAFLIAGAAAMLLAFPVDQTISISAWMIIGVLMILFVLGIVMIVKEWHPASTTVNWLYDKGFLKRWLEHGRFEVRRFEDLIYGFYRHYPKRFLPICLIELAYHSLGVAEVWFILNRITEFHSTVLSAFLLETISRLIHIVFKLIPFLIGVDEAGAQLVGETLALSAGIGVTLAIIRKGRILFWTLLGVLIIVKRGLKLSEITSHVETAGSEAA